MVRPPKKRAYHNFQKRNSEPEPQSEPSQDAPDQEAPQQADSNVDEDVTIQTPRKEDTSSPEDIDGEMKDPKMSLEANESNMADSSLQEAGENQSVTPTKSRFGRSHKPKVLGDFVSTDKKVSIVLKVSPVNQFKFYKDNKNNFAVKVKHERRGRPRKSLLRDSFGSQKTENGPPRPSQTDSPSSQKKSAQITPQSPNSQKTVQITECSPSSQKPAQIEEAVVMTSAAVVDEIDVKVDPEEMEPDPGCEWMVGDLAWARIGNHPFWPCIIARDPELGIFTRIRMFTKSLVPHRRLHVQFFGDNGRRSWLSSTSVMNYKGRAAFEELSQSILSAMKRKDPRQVSALVVKPNLKSVWESAVNEAESLLHSSREERVLHFKRLVRKIAISQKLTVVDGEETQPPLRIKRQYRKRKAENSQADPDYVVANKQIKLDLDAIAGQSSTPPVLTPRKRGRPRKTLTPIKDPLIKQEPTFSPSSRPVRLSRTVIKMEVDDSESSGQPDSESSSIDKVIDEVLLQSEERPKKNFRTPPAMSSEQLGKVRNKKAKLGAEFNKFSSKQFNKISSKHPEIVKEVDVRLEKMWKDLDDAQKSKFRGKLNCKYGGKQEDEEEEEVPVTPWDPEDTDEKTSTSEISESPLTLPLAPAKSRNKVSIFNGAFQGKVCQVCEKPGNTFRCKGPCCGTYHLECAANPRDFSARINEIFQAANAASSSASSSPSGLVGRKKKMDGRGRRKSSLVVQKEGEEAEINNEGEEEEEEKGDGRRKEGEDEGEKVDGRRRKSLVKVDDEEAVTNEEKKEKIDGRRRKSLMKEEGEEETATSEEKKEEVDGGRKKSTESGGLEKAVTNEEKAEKVDGRRRKSLATTEGGDVEESVTNEEKKEKIDGRRRKSLATTEGGDVEETVTNEEKKEKIDGRRRKSLATTEGGDVEETVTNEEKKEKIDGRRRKSLATTEGGDLEESVTNEEKKEKIDGRRRKSLVTTEEPSSSEEKAEKIEKERKKSSEEKELEEEKVDGRTEGEEDTKSRKIELRRKSKTEGEDLDEVKEKIDGRRRKSLVKTESELMEETEVNEEKVDRRRTRLADKELEGEVVANEGKKEKVDGRRKKALVKAESEESEEGKDESTTDSDVKGGDKKKGGARKGGSKESGDSSEEADSQSADFRCAACSEARLQACFVCGRDEFNGESSRQRCHVAHCGRVYHLECLKAWPQVNWIRSAGSMRGGSGSGEAKPAAFACPQHACHTCISDNPSVMKERFANDRLVKCLRCPASYHYGNHCLPAGTEIIAARQIICPQHSKKHKKGLNHVNASWCFICASGGSLICCDMCPTAFHADCLKISPPEGGYICEDCETGRFPLYGEIVWVKLGVYRWWPAQIMFPHHIPPNIRNLVHARGEFAVKFFGSHDFYWVNRGRVFLYQEGDSGGRCTSKRKATDQMFLRAVEEASEACMRLKNEKASREATHRSGMKPPSYIRIKTNKPVGQVRAMEANISSLTPCECDPNSANPCALDTDCLNRILMIECNPLICPAGVRCKNQQFEKREYPPLMPYRTDGRGWGLKTLVDLKKGEFVIEYVGEMINEVEYQRRLQKMHESNENNYYFLTIDKDRMLDAGPKGNVARFMNHSCQPNCETQKWTVNGDTRVGLFALHDIPAETELVFNYNLESIGTEKKPCMCGAPNCSGFIGVKASKNGNGIHTDDSVLEKQKKPRRRSRSLKQPAKLSDDICFICQQGGELLLCDGKHCTKAYHLNCLSRNKKHPVGYWLCPWHQCNVCCRGKVYRCNFCINSYCPTHAEGNIRLEDSIGYVCTKHGCTKGDKMKTDDKSKPAICESKPVESSASSSGDVTTTPIHEQLLASESASSSSAASSSEKQNNNVAQSAELKVLPRTRRARSNSDVIQTAVSAKMAESGVKLLRRIRRPASVDSLTIIMESEVPLKENLLRNAVLKRRSLKAQEERGNVPSVTSIENGEPKESVEQVQTPSENCNAGISNGVGNTQMNGHVENDSLGSEDSSKICDSTNRDEKVVENSTSEVDEKVTSEEVSEDGKGVGKGENPEEKNEQVLSESSSQEEKIEVEENGPSKVNEEAADVEMECESAASADKKVDADKTETIEKSDYGLDMEVTEETPDNEEVPSSNKKSTKDESSSKEVITKEEGSDKLRPDEKVTAKVNGILDEWSDGESEVGESVGTIEKNSSDSGADKETSEHLVDNCKTALDTVADCNSESNSDANILDECVLKKSADSKKHILPEDQDSLVT